MAAFYEGRKNTGPYQHYFILFRKKAIIRNKSPKSKDLFPDSVNIRNKWGAGIR